MIESLLRAIVFQTLSVLVLDQEKNLFMICVILFNLTK